MRCRNCGIPAVVNMRQHKLSLCAEHFSDWILRNTARVIRKYRMFGPDERILVAVSGGKDSLALWDVLLRLGYRADGLYIDLGIDAGLAYSAQSRIKAEAFAARCAAQFPETRLWVVDLPGQYGESLPALATRKHREGRPCSLCGLVKRHEMNRMALELGYDVLATGHNLDDEAATLFGNVMRWQTGYLVRQDPALPADGEGLARKVKPFCRIYERETAAYALLQGIDYIEAECPYAKGATSLQYKETLTQMEHDVPGTKLQFYGKFLQAKAAGLFAETAGAPELHPCSVCGQPTTADEQCSFCRLWDK